MKPFLILVLAVAPLVGACADEAHRPPPGRATNEALPRAARTPQPGADADWVNVVVSAKVAGSLYRLGAFFPHAPARTDPAMALP